MSDTPRTDALLTMRNVGWDQLKDHACSLERELANTMEVRDFMTTKCLEAQEIARLAQNEIIDLRSELAAERIKREAAERRLALVTGPMMSFDDWMTSRNQKYRPSDDTLALRELRECWRTAAGHSKLPKLEARLHDLGQAARP